MSKGLQYKRLSMAEHTELDPLIMELEFYAKAVDQKLFRRYPQAHSVSVAMRNLMMAKDRLMYALLNEVDTLNQSLDAAEAP